MSKAKKPVAHSSATGAGSESKGAAKLLKDKYGIDLQAFAAGAGDAAHSPRSLSFQVTMAASKEWRSKAEVLFDEDKYDEAAEAFSLAVRTAEASLQLLGEKLGQQQEEALDAMLECLASRGAAHFRMRTYDRMYADIDAARKLQERLSARPDVDKALKHLLSPGNVKPDVMRTPEAAARLKTLQEKARAEAMPDLSKLMDLADDVCADSDDEGVSAKPGAKASKAGVASGGSSSGLKKRKGAGKKGAQQGEASKAAAGTAGSRKRAVDTKLETRLADALGGPEPRRGIRWGAIGGLLGLLAAFAVLLMAFEFAFMQGIVDVGHLFGGGD